MTRADDIYWGSRRPPVRAPRRRIKPGTKAVVQPQRRSIPWWLSFVIVTSIFAMLAVSINFRAFTEMKEESNQNSKLAAQIQNLMDENVALQDEIHALKSDPAVIEREARKIGIELKK